MGSIVVLGGAGGVGRVAVEALTLIDSVDEVIVGDFRADVAAEVVAALASPKLRAVGVDVTDHDALVDLLRGADVVLNCVGPFYKLGPPLPHWCDTAPMPSAITVNTTGAPIGDCAL